MILNKLRSENGKHFDHWSDSNVITANDGTGSGKTYSVMAEFINRVEPDELKTVVFIAPQKNQLEIDKSLKDTAINKGIEVLMLRAKTDLADFDQVDILSDVDGTVGDMIDSITNDDFLLNRESKLSIERVIEDANEYIREVTDSRKKNRKDDEEEDENDEKEVNKYKKFNFSTIKDSKEAIIRKKLQIEKMKFNHHGKKEIKLEEDILGKMRSVFTYDLQGIANIILLGNDDLVERVITSEESDLDPVLVLLKRVIKISMPFEVAKYKPCIILSTVQKLSTLIPSVRGGNGSKRVDLYEYSYLMSSNVSCEKTDSKIFKYAFSDNVKETAEFINDSFFKKDERCQFSKRNVSFSLVMDEEHISSIKLGNNKNKNILDEKVNLLHSLASISRYFGNMAAKKKSDDVEYIESEYDKIKDGFTNDIIKNLIERDVFKSEEEIVKLFKNFEGNELGILVSDTDIDMIKKITSSAIALTPKILNNRESLESIKMKFTKDLDRARMYTDIKTINGSDDYFELSLYKFIQIAFAVIYSAKKLKSFKKLNIDKSVDNQNSAIYKLIKMSVNNSSFLDNLFESLDNISEDSEIGFIFSYFVSKVFFSVDESKDTSDDFDSDSTYKENIYGENLVFKGHRKVILYAKVLKEAEESNLIRFLSCDRNRLFLMSATSGMKNTKTGCVDLNALSKFSDIYRPNSIRISNRTGGGLAAFTYERSLNAGGVNIFDVATSESLKKINDKTMTGTKYHIPAFVNFGDVGFKKESYNIRPTDSFKKSNFKNLKSKFKQMYVSEQEGNNYYLRGSHIDQINNTIDCITNAIVNDENAMILGLTNKFLKYLDSSVFFGANTDVEPIDGGNLVDESDKENFGKLFKFKIKGINDRKYIVVLFNAPLGRLGKLKETLNCDDDTRVILISSFMSAGTGLNYTIGNKDFDSIYIIQSAYWTDVYTKKQGFLNDLNILNSFKHIDERGGVKLSESAEYIGGSTFLNQLQYENNLEIVKTYIQAFGRIERRDYPKPRNIYLVSNPIKKDKKGIPTNSYNINLFNNIIKHFFDLYNIHKDDLEESLIPNMSMNNRAIMNLSIEIGKVDIFDNKDLMELENSSQEKSKWLHKFFTDNNFDGFRKAMREYWNDNEDFEWFKEFNDIIRGFNRVSYNILDELNEFIINNQLELEESNYINQIKTFRNNIFDSYRGSKKICVDYKNQRYTDVQSGLNTISHSSIFRYGNTTGSQNSGEEDDDRQSALKFMQNINKTVGDRGQFKDKSNFNLIPSVYFLNIIAGNIGELAVFEYIKELKEIGNLDIEIGIDGIIDSIKEQKRLYEVFDLYVYVENSNTLLCIDVKNWSLRYDAPMLKAMESIDSKISKVESIESFKGFNIEYIYLNASPDANDEYTDTIAKTIGSNSKYYNLILKNESSKFYYFNTDLKRKLEAKKRIV